MNGRIVLGTRLLLSTNQSAKKAALFQMHRFTVGLPAAKLDWRWRALFARNRNTSSRESRCSREWRENFFNERQIVASAGRRRRLRRIYFPDVTPTAIRGINLAPDHPM